MNNQVPPGLWQRGVLLINNLSQKFINLCPYKQAESNATRFSQNLYVCTMPVTRRVAAFDSCFVLKVIRAHQHGIVRRNGLVKNHWTCCLLHRKTRRLQLKRLICRTLLKKAGLLYSTLTLHSTEYQIIHTCDLRCSRREVKSMTFYSCFVDLFLVNCGNSVNFDAKYRNTPKKRYS